MPPITVTVAVGDTNFAGPVSLVCDLGLGKVQQANESTITPNWYDDPANGKSATTPTTAPGMLIDTFSQTAIGTAGSFRHGGAGSAVS